LGFRVWQRAVEISIFHVLKHPTGERERGRREGEGERERERVVRRERVVGREGGREGGIEEGREGVKGVRRERAKESVREVEVRKLFIYLSLTSSSRCLDRSNQWQASLSCCR
jgi:hypothetical protein